MEIITKNTKLKNTKEIIWSKDDFEFIEIIFANNGGKIQYSSKDYIYRFDNPNYIKLDSINPKLMSKIIPIYQILLINIKKY